MPRSKRNPMDLMNNGLERKIAELDEAHARRFTVSYMYADHSYPPRVVPYIRLRGRWLDDLGFRPGLGYTAYVGANLLVLVADPLEPQPMGAMPRGDKI